MHQSVAAGRRLAHRRVQLRRAFGVLRADPGRPFRVGRRDARTGRLHDRVERRGRRREQRDVAAPVVAQLAGVVRDAHEARVPEHGRRAVGELEIELATDRDHHVRLAHHRAAHRRDDGRMIVGHESAALAGVEVQRIEPFEEAAERLRCAARAAAGDHERTPSGPQQVDGTRDGVRVGELPRARPGLEVFEQLRRDRDLGAQRVDREVEIDRPGLAAVAERA